jgi:hypothetical protein
MLLAINYRQFMRKTILYLTSILIIACGQTHKTNKSDDRADTIKASTLTEQNSDTLAEDRSETFYLVQVASGHNFDSLKNISNDAASILKSKVDMMNRIYKPNKGIVLPESCDDDMYCGKYFPRRPFGDQNFVSIEMLYGFEDSKKWTDRDTLQMIVLANIFSTKHQADSLVGLLKNKIRTAKTIEQDLYLGCMH